MAGTLADALRQCGTDPEVFVIGGEQIFRAALPVAQRLYLTTIEIAVEGDTTMPPIDLSQWRLTSQESHPVGEGNPLPWTFQVYERAQPSGAA